MSKDILVLGGSYFAGRVFSISASRSGDFNLTVVNRGRYPLNLPNVTEVVCDRHETEKLLDLIGDSAFDAVVDFCAYGPGDIEPIARGLGKRAGQYVFISSCSVYDPAWEGMKTEKSPTLRLGGDTAGCCGVSTKLSPSLKDFGNDPISDFIRGKLLLESELEKACGEAGIPCTIIRPAFIFGPYNYALRESFYIQRMVKGTPSPVPTDSTAHFSVVYVADLAKVLMACAGDERAFGEVFNIASPDAIDYGRLIEALESAQGSPMEKEEMTVEEILAGNIVMPFPIVGDELFDGGKVAAMFDIGYTSFEEGMAKTYKAFRSVYAG